jgi:DNA-binding CsgD family transcriptional regulator
MEQKSFNIEFNKLIPGFTNKFSPRLTKLQQNFHKRFWNLFLLGDSYYFILNHQNFSIEFVSKEVEDVLGYQANEFDVQFMSDKIHPDDRSWFLSFGNRVVDFFSHLSIDKLMRYKVRYDIRMKKMNGDYSRILYQGILIDHDPNGGFLRTLNVHTDISYLKQEGKPVLSFIGMDGEPSYFDVALNNEFIESKEELTRREKQVLKLLIEGKLSKEIGSILKITKQTVDTHRQNILHKKKLNNTSELISKAIRGGWI